MAEVGNSNERSRPLRTFLTVLWALVPALTLGMGTPIVMIHAAARMRDVRQAAATAVYVVTTAMMFIADRDVSTTQQVLFDSAMVVSLIGGTGHALAIRPWVWNGRLPNANGQRPRTLRTRQEEALAAQADRQAARESARAIVDDNPQQAVELAIGRPDIERGYPDGGLIDVNNVPAHILVSALAMSDSEAEAVVRTRTTVGGFSSVADLSVTMSLTPQRLDAVAALLIFLPLRHR